MHGYLLIKGNVIGRSSPFHQYLRLFYPYKKIYRSFTKQEITSSEDRIEVVTQVIARLYQLNELLLPITLLLETQ